MVEEVKSTRQTSWLLRNAHLLPFLQLVLVRIKPCEQSRKGGPTQGGRDVTTPEQGAFRGQLVEVRGLDMGMPHKTVIGVALVVRKDQDDVGGLGPA